MAAPQRPLTPKQELFCQAMATGVTLREAQLAAGYAADPAIGSRMRDNPRIAARIKELQDEGAAKVGVTQETIAAELEEARQLAIREGQASAAVAASMGKAKLFGLLIDKSEVTGKDGGPIEVTTIVRKIVKAGGNHDNSDD